MEIYIPTEDDFASEPSHAGDYRGRPLDWTIKNYDSGAGALVIRFKVTNEWFPGKNDEPGAWSGEWPQGYYVESKSWIIGKDGNLKDGAIANLAKCGLWNGDFDAVAGPPPAVFCLLSVEGEDYNGKTYFRASWVNPDAPEPSKRSGGFAPIEKDALAAMRAKFGGKAKAIAGSATGAPSTPAAPAAATPAAPGVPAAPGGAAGPTPAPITATPAQTSLEDEGTRF